MIDRRASTVFSLQQVSESRVLIETERHTCPMTISDDYTRPAAAYVRPKHPYLLSSQRDFRRDGFRVSGVFYRQESIKKLPIGVDLIAELIPEPDNPYDFNAVCVEVEGIKVGYLSRKLTVFWHDIVAHLNTQGFYAETLSRIQRSPEDQLEYGVLLDLPTFAEWGEVHTAVGLDTEFYALRDALPPALWQRLLANCWEEISDDDHRSVARYRGLAPSAKWREYEAERGAPTIPDRLLRRFREEVLAERRSHRSGT
jgi:hypothetical protein